MIVDDRKRVIGKVISVAADKFTIELSAATDNFTIVGYDDVHYVARLGSFVIIPVQSEYVVAEIVGLREREAAGGPGHQDGTKELDKATSAKFLDVVPVGMLPRNTAGSFKFGVSSFPSLYSDALYVLDAELDRIFQVEDAAEPAIDPAQQPTRLRALTIGRSVVFQGYDVKVKVDEFFGGHVAVLGNTGSGKSCTIATILQSLFEKPDEYAARGATFIVFDVNGEYRGAFSKLPPSIKRLYLRVSGMPADEGPEPLDEHETTGVFRLPHWFMTAEEWELLLRASERTQQPVLRTALGLATLFSNEEKKRLSGIQDHILASCLLHILQSELGSPSKKDRITAILSSFSTQKISLSTVGNMIAVSYGGLADAQKLAELLNGYILENVTLPSYRHIEFSFDSFGKALDLALLYEEAHGNRQIRDYCSSMMTRFKAIQEREEFGFIRMSPDQLGQDNRHLEIFVERLLGIHRRNDRLQKNAQVVLVDMNEAEDEVVEVASAVVSRMIFERLRRAEPRNKFPVNLVLEEAHRYVAERPSRYAIDASRIFERIAKEGRKYGMFLTVASQRPSELSKTVLSQCSNFVVHRIQNPDDLTHIRQMTPFISDSVLRRLPSLPKQHALIFGNAVNIPTTFRVRDVDPAPKSDDAKIRELWFKPEDFTVGLSFSKIESASVTQAHQADTDFDVFG